MITRPLLALPFFMLPWLSISFTLGKRIRQITPKIRTNSNANAFFRRLDRHLEINANDRSLCRVNMCICIDCARVTNCAAYHFVETKHEQPHMTEDPTFEPRDGSPTIHVNIRTIRDDEDRKREVQRMWREHENQTKMAEEEAMASNIGNESPLFGTEKYNLSPVTTYEYDVVSCEDYVHDVGCWVRNMPEKIKNANPNFVPT
mmetsp:Transcript_13721/g.19614  ORF Transcript_13721/g.19614 Transcript_13721/m.19614 type:complete len:203 (-) Transcript_13721:444-1052(-)